MKTLEGRVAVVTGASSGIGLAVAAEFARQGMSVVIASQNAERLAKAEEQISSMGAPVLAVPTDVEDRGAVERLASATLDRFGAVHVLVNNAGVYAPGYAWEISDDDWEWVVGVNLWGTVYGIKAFMPHLLAQEEAHVVNVASAGGLMTAPCHGPYAATKHAIVGLSKGLRAEFAIKQARVGITLVCPGGVATNITSQMQTTGPGGRPREGPALAPEVQALWDGIDGAVDAGISPDAVGPMVSEAILADRFWVLPNAECFFDVFDREMSDLKAGA
ncbi:MAG: SDR family NAD(P)-dependent oxidoreductase [Deltaproteobacteria bacterium]|nr:SDR family NAD(P)-dependent oxidoreductase [Deltaproteobacteria bacterium]MBW2361537.1 SDR family NAD(P)-dependent oxidoreductase [Deltaproteobacteria bacterium]